MRVNRGDRGRLVLREPGAARRVRARRAASTCSASSPTAASTRTSTTCARCSASRRRRPGSTPSPTAATSRRTRPSTTSPSCPPSGSRRVCRPLLRDGPRPALGAHGPRASTRSSSASGEHADDPGRRPCSGATTRASRTSSSSRSSSRRPARDRARRRGDLLQLPPRPRAPALAAAARGGLRPDDDDALPRRPRLPGRLRGAGGGTSTMAEVLAEHGAPPAALRRDREVRARHLLLQRRPRGGMAGRESASSSRRPREVGTYDKKPEMSARRGRASASRPRSATATVRDRQLRQPGHGRSHRLDPGGRRRPSRRPTAAWARRRRRRARRRHAARHRRPRERRDDARGRTASARTRRTRRTPSRSSSPTPELTLARRR